MANTKISAMTNASALGGTEQLAGVQSGANVNVTPSQIKTFTTVGTSTNDNAAAGSVGEYVSSNIATGSAVSLTTTTTANVTSVSLTAGDWDVWGAVAFKPGGTTSLTVLNASVSTTSATNGALNAGSFAQWATAANVVGANDVYLTLAPARISLAGTTTVYLTATGTFSVSTLAAYGILQARRRR